MPLLIGIFILLAPRLSILAIWYFTAWFDGVFETALWPVLGFFFTPLTMLWFSVVENVYAGQWDTLQIVIGIIVLLIDLSPSSSKRKKDKS